MDCCLLGRKTEGPDRVTATQYRHGNINSREERKRKSGRGDMTGLVTDVDLDRAVDARR